MLKSSFPPESSGFDKPRFIPFKPGSSEFKRLYCFKGLPIFQSGNVRVLFYSTLKFFESFKVISLFSYQGPLQRQTNVSKRSFAPCLTMSPQITMSINFQAIFSYVKRAEKEGFEPSRRY